MSRNKDKQINSRDESTRQRAGIGFALVVVLLDVVGIGLAIPVLPKLVEHLLGGNVSAAATLYGVLAGLYSLMQFIFAPLLGALSDRFGRRPIILIALAGSALDYVLLAVAPSVGWFFLGRAISGLTGASIAAAGAYVADVTPPARRAQAYGLIGAMFGIGFVIGPLLGGILGDFHLRLPFIVAAFVTTANLIYGVIVMPESLPPSQRSSFRLAQANPLRIFFLLREEPILSRLATVLFLLYLAQSALNNVWVIYADYRYGWTRTEIGVSLALVGIMAIIVKGQGGPAFVRRLGEWRVVQLGLLILICSYIGYGLAWQGWMVYLLIVLGSLGGITTPALLSLMSKRVPPGRQGMIQGIVSCLMSLAGILAPPIATSVFGFFVGPLTPVHLPGAPLFLASGLMILALVTISRHEAAAQQGLSEHVSAG